MLFWIGVPVSKSNQSYRSAVTDSVVCELTSLSLCASSTTHIAQENCSNNSVFRRTFSKLTNMTSNFTFRVPGIKNSCSAHISRSAAEPSYTMTFMSVHFSISRFQCPSVVSGATTHTGCRRRMRFLRTYSITEIHCAVFPKPISSPKMTLRPRQ